MTSAGWKWIEQGVDLLWPVSLELIFAATLMLAIALAIDLGLRRAAAAVRHRAWALIMGGLLLLPLLCPVLPKVPVRLGIPIAATSPLSLTQRSSESTVIAPRQEQSQSDVAAFPATDPVDPFASPASVSAASTAHQAASPAVETPVGDGPSLLAGSYGVLMLLWAAGIVLCLVAMARSLWTERRLAKSSSPLDDPSWQTLLDEIRRQLGVCWAVAVGLSQQTEVPLTIGWLRPKILLPVDCTQWTAAKRRVVLVHELSHVARHDVFWQIVARLACAVYWLHPLAWLADRRMRVERELACDDAVLRAGGRPDQYASVLLDVAAAVCRRSPTGAAAIAMACRHPIERRIRAILQPGLSRLPVGRRTSRLLLLGVLVCVIVTAALHPFTPPPVNADPAKPEAAARQKVNDPSGRTPADGNTPAKAKKQAEDDIDVRFATAAAKMAKVDYDQAVEANEKVPGTVPQAEVRKRLLEWQKMELAILKAKHVGGDIDVRYAAAAATVAKADYEQAVEANKTVPGTVPQAEVRKRLLEWQKMELAILKAKHVGGDIDVRYAAAAATVAKADYEQAVEANKTVPGTVPQAEVQKRLLEWQKMELAVAKAKKDVKAEPENVPAERKSANPATTPALLPKPAPAKPQAVAAAEQGHEKARTDSLNPEKPGVRSSRFRVIDQEGKPVAGAKVQLWGVMRRGLNRFYPPAVQTDKDGTAAIDFASEPTTYVVVFVWADRYVTAGARWESNDAKDSVPAEFTLTLEPGTTMGGIVRNEQGQPIVGAEVAISGQEDLPGGHRFYQADDKVRTDAQGKWTSHRIPKNLGQYVVPRLKVKHADYATPPELDLSRQPLDDLRAGTAVMVMRKGIAVEGIVTDPQGKPVAGALVGQFAELPGSDFPRTRTDPKGFYRLPACEPGTFTVAAASKGFAPDSQQVIVDKKSPTVDLQLRKGELIRILVVDKQGKPLPGAQVSMAFDSKYREALFVDYHNACEGHYYRALTDAEGRWSTLWLPNDKLDFYISKPGYTKVQTRLPAGQLEEVITLQAGGWTLSGRVVDHDTKAPITKFYLVEGSAYGNLMWGNNKVVANSKGEYREQWDTSGNSHRAVRIEADGYLPSEPRLLRPDERAVTFNVELRKGDEIVGIVRGPDGKPVANTEVGLASASRLLLLRNSRPAQDQNPWISRTGADGRFAFAPQGEPYVLVALHNLGFARIDGDANRNEMTLQPWARVEGTLYVDGRPAAKEHLRIVFDDEVFGQRPPPGMPMGGMPIDPGRYLYYEYQTQTDDKGHFAFERVRPGTAKLSHFIKVSQDGDMSSWKDGESQAIDVVPGKKLTVNIGMPAGK